jgi:hypothetical protein
MRAAHTTTAITYRPVRPGHPTVMKASIARIPTIADRAMPAVARPCTRPNRRAGGVGRRSDAPGRETMFSVADLSGGSVGGISAIDLPAN